MGEMVTVTLDADVAERMQAEMEAGGYGSVSDVVAAALEALACEPDPFDDPDFVAYAKAKVDEALNDPRPDVPIDEAFARIEERIRRRHAG